MTIRSTLTKRAGEQARQEVAGWELARSANLTMVRGSFGKNQNFPKNLRFRMKICASKFAVKKNKILV